VKPETVFRAAAACLVTMAVVLTAIGVAWTQPDKETPLDASLISVAVIVESMEETRAQAVALPAGYLRIGCAWEGLDPTLRDAYKVLVADPLFSRWVQVWRTEYWDGLVACSKGDLPKASAHLTPAFDAADKMVAIAGRPQ
jgi:hypothetical protein